MISLMVRFRLLQGYLPALDDNKSVSVAAPLLGLLPRLWKESFPTGAKAKQLEAHGWRRQCVARQEEGYIQKGEKACTYCVPYALSGIHGRQFHLVGAEDVIFVLTLFLLDSWFIRLLNGFGAFIQGAQPPFKY